MTAVMYLRVSGESQVQGDGLPRQREACLKYAAANAIEIVAEFADEGVTGKMELENREGLSACIHAVREQGIKLVIVESSDRLARDLIVAEVCIREFQKIGVRVVSASGGVDLTAGDDSNPTAKLVRQILSAVAEFDRCVIVLKLKGARQRKKADTGRCEGRKPYGDRPGEAENIARMVALRAAGATFQEIADTLNAEAVPTRSSGRWSVGTIGKILTR